MSKFTEDQVKHLLQPINPARVLGMKKGTATLSYVAQHDVRAHLTRMFGFGGWSMDVLDTEFMHETENNGRWVACYRSTVKITVYAEDGTEVCHYTDTHASGNMPQPDRAEAHALALTTATSTAMKRAATCLGDQFGLSLYNKGQKTGFVLGTLIGGTNPEAPAAPVTSLGDEADQASDSEGQQPQRADSDVPEAPVGDPAGSAEQQVQAVQDEAAEMVTAFLDDLRAIARDEALEPGDRILKVASLKAKSPDGMLQHIGPTGVSLGVLADRVAAGRS